MQIIFYETSNSAFTQMDDRNTQLEKKEKEWKEILLVYSTSKLMISILSLLSKSLLSS